MKIIAEPCKAHELSPGDLFSTEGPDYWHTRDWSNFVTAGIGQRVFIRTEAGYPEWEALENIFRIRVEK